jgi:radical SAM protein with 4Fe4S-binding SPASM domain
MIQQVNNQTIRKEKSHEIDISYLSQYYKDYGQFPLFQQVLIETRTDCNNNCPFCPHHFNKKKLGIMTWGCYCRIIDNLCEIGYNGRVALMVSNEPLLDNRLPDMIKYAKSKSPRLFLDITTNGRLLTLDMVDHLFSLGLDNININDYRGDRDLKPNGLSKNLEPIFNAYQNNVKITFQKRRFDEKWPNYGGNIPQVENSHDLGFCNFPFRKLTISYAGNVLLCCDDFMYDTSFGNVMNNSLIDCWNHPQMNEIRQSLLNNKRIGLCKRCNDFQNYNIY